ncbi:MAG: discoidin domain-containing protein [Chloroflexota bacterium]
MQSRFKFWKKNYPLKGQGFAEYALILMFVGVAALISVTILEPSLGGVFSRIVGREQISPPTLANYQAPPTPTFDPNYTPEPTNTPDPAATATPDSGGGGGGPSTPTPAPTETATNTPEPLPQVCNTYSSSDTPISLPNGTNAINSDIAASSGNGPIYDVNVTVDMSHVWVGDLMFTVSSPSGESVRIMDQPGLPASSYGCSGDNISATLDDAAALPIEDQCAGSAPTISGTFSPNNPLSAFNNLDAGGSWTLTVDDEYPSADSGTLNSWSIEICTGGGQPATPTPIPQPTSTPIPVADNLCLIGTTSQSSTSYSGDSSLACDGNRDGAYSNGSVTHTSSESNPWWEVDLGRIYVLQQLKIFNRTDCCGDRLSNFYVFISDDPFSSTDLNTTLNQNSVDSFFFDGNVDALAYAFTQQSGRYVRIQSTSSDPLSLAEVEVYGSLWVPTSCEGVADMFYIFDLSGSMAWNFDGSTTKIQAAKDAVTNLNNAIAADNSNHRVGFTTFTATPFTNSNGAYSASIQTNSLALTSDIPSANAAVEAWIASGGTPTGAALNAARLTVVDDWDPLRIPVIVLVSDGVPTIDQQERYTYDSQVEAISIYDGSGNAYPASTIETSGDTNDHGVAAGHVVADAMYEAEELVRALPNATIHSIAIGGSSFNGEVLQYVADVGGGQYFSASNATELSNQLLSIFNGITCGGDS